MKDAEILKAVDALKHNLWMYHVCPDDDKDKEWYHEHCYAVLQDFIDHIQDRKHDMGGRFEDVIKGKLTL